MRLNVSPPPPPTMLKHPGRTLVGVAAVSPGGFRAPLPPPALANPNVAADWEDEAEDDVTEVYAERATLVFKRVAPPRDDETTRELPGHAVRPAPAPPAVSLPPWGFDVFSASMARASLPPPEFVAALVRANEARTPPPRLGVPSMRVGAAVTAAAVVALVALWLKPAPGKLLVDARDSRGGPVNRLEVFVDGERTLCNAVPCDVPSRKGLHEVKVVAEGFEVPATQAVAVASGDPTAVHFILGSSTESGKVSGSQDGVKLAVDGKETGPLPQRDPAPAQAMPTHDVKATPGLPAHPAPAAPAAPAAKTSPARSGGGVARDGYLNINSIPASTCFVDGKSLGSTPRLRVSVSAGSHTVKFRSSDSGSTKTVVVNVGAGETRLAVARLN